METSRVAASQHTGSQLSLNSSVATSGGSPIQHRFQQRQQQNGTVKSTSPRVGGAEEDMKRTLKAARIQRDVDVLNHTFEDLEAFLKDVRLRLDAYREYEEKKKNAKKHDGEWGGQQVGVGRAASGSEEGSEWEWGGQRVGVGRAASGSGEGSEWE